MEQLFDGLFRVLDPRAVLAIVLLRFEVLQEPEARGSSRVSGSAVLGHAETLLATMRHLITNERVRLISCPREPPPGPSFMQFAESTIRGKDSPDRQKARDWDGRFARTFSGEFAKVILRLEPLPCGQWVSSIVAEFRAGKSTVRSAYSRDGDNCAMQLRRRVQTH
jgi:hypothetical protein